MQLQGNGVEAPFPTGTSSHFSALTLQPMPKRSTLTYSSTDGPSSSEPLHVYYCKYSGRHALSTDCDLSKAPRRNTDGAIVLDTEFYAVKLYTTTGVTKYIKRRRGGVERQAWEELGKLHIGYRSVPEGRFLYVLSDALSEYSGPAASDKARRPAPPCISELSPETSQVLLEVDDRAAKAALLKISSDYVRVQIVQGIAHEKAAEELLHFMRDLLGVRLAQLMVVRGDSTRQKRLLVKGLTPSAVYHKLEAGL